MAFDALAVDAVQSTPTSTDDRPQNWILEHTGLVRAIAHSLARRMPRHVDVDVDDLIQAGTVGLLEAAQRYNARGEHAFVCFACPRIRGAILDFVRKSAWGSRSLHRRLRAIAAAKSRIERETGEIAKSSTVAATLGISLGDYHRALQDQVASTLLSLDAPPPDESSATLSDVSDTSSADPVEELVLEERRRTVAKAIDALPESERVIMLLYYDQEFLLHEIGDVLGLSASRISQLHNTAIERIRRRIERQSAPSDDSGERRRRPRPAMTREGLINANSARTRRTADDCLESAGSHLRAVGS